MEWLGWKLSEIGHIRPMGLLLLPRNNANLLEEVWLLQRWLERRWRLVGRPQLLADLKSYLQVHWNWRWHQVRLCCNRNSHHVVQASLLVQALWSYFSVHPPIISDTHWHFLLHDHPCGNHLWLRKLHLHREFEQNWSQWRLRDHSTSFRKRRNQFNHQSVPDCSWRLRSGQLLPKGWWYSIA